MSMKFKNHAGVPLGGIGAGKVEFCPDGAFRNLTFHNNIDVPISGREITRAFRKEGITGCFMGAYVEGAKAVALKELDAPGINTLPENSIEYEGLLPFVNTKYPDMENISISMEAFSPLILDDDGKDDYKDSSLPVASFTLKAKNNGNSKKYTSFVFSWYNMIGMGGYPAAYISDRRDNYIEFREDNDTKQLYYGYKLPKVDKRVQGNYTLALKNSSDYETSYMIWPPTFLNIEKGEGMWNHFTRDGKLPNLSMPAAETETDLFGALAAGKTLNPGEEFEVTFVLGWYFPEKVANKIPDLIYKNMYTRWFENSTDVVSYFFNKKDNLYERTKRWHNSFNDSNLPKWLQVKLINDIFPLYSGSYYIDDGRFGSNEAPSYMNGCMGTIDQRAASNSIYTMCFPKLSKSELKLFGDQQITADDKDRYGLHWDATKGDFGKEIDRLGAIRHDIGWDELEAGKLGNKYWTNLHWPDLVTVFTLQAYEQYIWTNDTEFLDYVYPKIKLALKFEKELDQDGDGIADLWGPGCNTYDNDNFPYYGASSFVATLYLAALKATIQMAEIKKDNEYKKEIEELFDNVKSVVEDKLWSEDLGYYLSWVDDNHMNWENGERPHKKNSTNSMIAQLAGQWFTNMFDLGDILDKKRIKSAIKKMAEKNIDLVKYCPANEVSADDSWISFSWPYYTETYFAANAVYEGYVDEGLKALENIYKAMHEEDGSPWSAPLAWEGEGNKDRGWGYWYMTNPASWFILPALGGININLPLNQLMLSPNIPNSWGELVKLPVFTPNVRGNISANKNKVTFTIEKFINMQDFLIETISSKISIKEILVNEKNINFSKNNETDYAVEIVLKAGDKLTLIK